MIFSCGLTLEEKRRREDWHDFFALLPRTVAVEDGRFICAWMQTIQRRSTYYLAWDGPDWANEYRLKP